MNNENTWLEWLIPALLIGSPFLVHFILFLSKDIPKDKKYRSYGNIYLILYGAFILAFVLGNIFKIPFFENMPRLEVFIAVFIILILIGNINRARLDNYLKKNHRKKWEELNAINSSFGFGSDGSSRESNSSHTDDSLNDPIVAQLESENNKIFLLCMVHFILMPILTAVDFHVGLK